MSLGKSASSVATDWMEKISDMMGDTDSQLDQVKKSIQKDLEELRKEKNVESLAVNLYHLAEIGFRKDLQELNVQGAAQTEYLAMFRQAWEQKEMKRKSNEILQSNELVAIDEFIADLGNLPKLKELIESAEPQPKWMAMLKGFASRIPGMDKNVDEYFGPIMNALGLGFLVKAKDKTATQTASTSTAPPPAGTAPAESTDKTEAEKASEQREATKPMTPKSTCFIGDSITAGMATVCAAQKEKNPLKIDGEISTIAKGGMDTGWGIRRLKERQSIMEKTGKNPFEGVENAVVLFGTNDIGVSDAEGTKPENEKFSARKIFERLEEIYRMLKEVFHVKYVYAVTVPPYGGYGAYDKRGDKLRAKKKELNDRILGNPPYTRSKYIYRVMDTCKTESQGGLASDEDPNRFSKRANGDYLHPKKEVLGEFYQRELELGTGAAAQKETEKRKQEKEKQNQSNA